VQQPVRAKQSHSSTSHNSPQFSNLLGQTNPSFLQQNNSSAHEIGFSLNVAAINQSSFAPHSLDSLYVPANHSELWNGNIDTSLGFSSDWPIIDTTTSYLPFQSYMDQTSFDTPDLDTSQGLMLTPDDDPLFTPDLGAISSPSFTPEHSSNRNSSASPDNHSLLSGPSLDQGSPNCRPTSLKPTKSPKDDHSKVQKRTLNTLAARRYRQKRLDQMSELEAALKESNAERDVLKVRVARLEGEVDVLRGLLTK